MTVTVLTEGQLGRANLSEILNSLTLAPEKASDLAEVELDYFGLLKPTDSSCYGALDPCKQTCC